MVSGSGTETPRMWASPALLTFKSQNPRHNWTINPAHGRSTPNTPNSYLLTYQPAYHTITQVNLLLQNGEVRGHSHSYHRSTSVQSCLHSSHKTQDTTERGNPCALPFSSKYYKLLVIYLSTDTPGLSLKSTENVEVRRGDLGHSRLCYRIQDFVPFVIFPRENGTRHLRSPCTVRQTNAQCRKEHEPTLPIDLIISANETVHSAVDTIE